MASRAARGRAPLRRLRLVAAALVVLAVAVAHDAPPAQAQPLTRPDTSLMWRSCSGFYLFWDESPGATGYQIQISSQSGSTWGTWSDVTYTGTAQPAKLTGLTDSTKYRWRIRAFKGPTNNRTYSAWAVPTSDDERTARDCPEGKPNPPIARSAVPGPGKITLTWEPGDVIEGALVAGWRVRYRWVDEHEVEFKRSLNAVSADTTTAEVTGLTPGTEYDVWVAPIAPDLSIGAASQALTATPQSTSTPTVNPGRCNHQGATPPGLTPISSFTSTHDSITLNWDSPDSGTTASGRTGFITNFLVWVVKVSDGSYDGLQIVTAHAWAPGTYSHTISGLSASTDYSVRVNARTIQACYSGWSSVAVSTTAALNHGGLQIGVLPRPTQEEQPEQEKQAEQPETAPASAPEPDSQPAPENEQQSDSQPAPETETGSAPEPETESAPETESESEAASAPDPQPAPEAESEPVPEPDDVVARYDANGDGVIDATEYRQVKSDWLAGKVTYDEFLKVVRAYLK